MLLVAVVLSSGSAAISWASSGGLSTASANVAAVLAASARPFSAFASKDARLLCSSFTARAASRLADRQRGPCPTRVARLLAAGELFDPQAEQWTAGSVHLQKRGRQQSAIVKLSGVEQTLRLRLVRRGRRWLVATTPSLIVVPGCDHRVGARNCPAGAKLVIFGFAQPAAGHSPLVTPPAWVRHAGAATLREFRQGARIFVESGCLACHRIGDVGNPGPGHALTHVGAHLDEAAIERALTRPLAPMPSFKNLPKDKLHALVRFLALLR
jgi:Cytochrome C oxidase, cbb3-type, subunit III